MTDTRVITYRLRAVADSSSAAAIKGFGRDIDRAINGTGRSGGGFGRITDGLKSAKKEASALERQMTALNATHNKRLAAEERISARQTASIDKQIAAFKKKEAVEIASLRKRELAEEAAAKKAEEREHKRHRLRQRSVAAQNRADREAEALTLSRDEDRQHSRHRLRQRAVAMGNRSMRDSLNDLPSYVGGGPVSRPAGMGRATTGNTGTEQFRSTVNRSAEAVSHLTHGILQLGLLSEQSSEKLLRGIVAVEGGMHLGRGLVNLGPVGGLAGAGIAAAGGVALGATSAVGFGRDVAQFGLGQGSAPGSYNDYAGGMIAKGFGSLYKSAGGSRSNFASAFLSGSGNWVANMVGAEDATKRQEGQTGIENQRIGRSLLEQEGKTELMRLRHESADFKSSAAAIRDTSPIGALRRNREALSATKGDMDSAAAEEKLLRTEKEKAAARERGLEAQKRLIGLLGEEQRLTADITANILSRRDAHIGAASEAAERFGSAAERFGNLSPEDQRRAIRLKRSADEADMFDRVAGGRSRRGDSVRLGVGREDSQFLAGLGDEQSVRFGKLSSLARAERGGFGVSGFAQSEREQFGFHSRAAKNLDKFALSIQPPNVTINVSPGVDEVSNALAARAAMEIKAWATAVEARTAKQIKDGLAQVNRNDTAAVAQRQVQASTARGRP